jgi:serine protease AprX
MIDEARQVIRDILGDTVGSKASPEFCLVFGRPGTEGHSAILEGKPLFVQNQPVIIEFGYPSAAVDDAYLALDRFINTEDWASFGRTVRGLIDLDPDFSQLVPSNAGHYLRQAKIAIARDDFNQAARVVLNEVERLTFALFEAEFFIDPWFYMPQHLTRACWLNRSIKTYLNPRMLTDLVADDKVSLMDVPRPLSLELNVTGQTVNAVNFRSESHKTGKGVIVAIIDQEVRTDHPALPNVRPQSNFSREPLGKPGSHATQLAGIIASNDKKFTGMAPDVQIFNYKIEASNAKRIRCGESIGQSDDFHGTEGIEQALRDHAHIANCSWGTGPVRDGTSREARAVDQAWKCGMVVVKSAGNCGPDGSTMTIPADADGVIVVGATDREGFAVQDYSSRGPANGRSRPDLIAPGGTDRNGIMTCDPAGPGFQPCPEGTSFAAAHVSGILALLMDGNMTKTPDQLRTELLSLCHNVGRLPQAEESGRGLIRLP